MVRLILATVAISIVGLCAVGSVERPATVPIELTTFSVELNPPIGIPNCLPPEKVKSIEHPIYAKGVILKQNQEKIALIALDWLAINHESNLWLREAVAEAIGTTPEKISVHALHQHTTLTIDETTQKILDTVPGSPTVTDHEYAKNSRKKIATAAKESLKHFQNVTHVGTSWAPVNQVASNRRIRLPDGRIMIRFSSAKDPVAIAAAEGKIDGFLRTISFFQESKPLAHLHYFATHPQSFYGDGRITPDVPGLARAKLEEETKTPHLYFSGCGGDVGMGKYNDGKPERRDELSSRLAEAMRKSLQKPTRYPVNSFQWATTTLKLESRSDAAFSDETARMNLENPKGSPSQRSKGAFTLAFNQRVRDGKLPFELRGLAIGPVRILHLPGESFVEYQLWTQQQFPDSFVAMAAYADCGMWYIPDDAAYQDRGGYEQTFAQAAPCETEMKKKIRLLMEQLSANQK